MRDKIIIVAIVIFIIIVSHYVGKLWEEVDETYSEDSE